MARTYNLMHLHVMHLENQIKKEYFKDVLKRVVKEVLYQHAESTKLDLYYDEYVREIKDLATGELFLYNFHVRIVNEDIYGCFKGWTSGVSVKIFENSNSKFTEIFKKELLNYLLSEGNLSDNQLEKMESNGE